MKKIRCMIIRGGTSKGVFFKECDLPYETSERDNAIMRIMASGEPAQVDGLGCGLPHTSKIMIVKKSEKEQIDIEYLFGQVGINRAFIDYTGNCGNLTSAVGPFAIESGMIKPKSPFCSVATLNINTGKRIDQIVQCSREGVIYSGNYRIDGVKMAGSPVRCRWIDPSGAVTGKLLPTGNPIDLINIDGRSYEISVVDAGNPAVFVNASDLGLKGTELDGDIPSEKMRILEKLRSVAAAMIGMVENPEEAIKKSPHLPFVAIVGKPTDYVGSCGEKIKKEDCSVVSRLFSMQKMHHAYAVSAAISLASASVIEKSVVNNLSLRDGNKLIIGHPRGIMDLYVKASDIKDSHKIDYVEVTRTARLLMSGYAYI